MISKCECGAFMWASITLEKALQIKGDELKSELPYIPDVTFWQCGKCGAIGMSSGVVTGGITPWYRS